MSDAPALVESPAQVIQVIVDTASKVVLSAVRSNIAQTPGPGRAAVDVTEEQLGVALSLGLGRCTFDGTAFAAYAPSVPLADLRAAQIATLQAACRAHIVSGYLSSALGAPHVYPSNPTDQSNMTACVVDSLLPHPADWTTVFWCSDASGAWAFAPHTAAQIQQAGSDGKAAIVAAQSKLAVLSAQVAAAATPADVAAVTW